MWVEALDKLKVESQMSDKMYNSVVLFLVNSNLDEKQKREVVSLMEDFFVCGKIKSNRHADKYV